MLALFNLVFSLLAGIGGFVVLAALAIAVYILHTMHSDGSRSEFTKHQLKAYTRLRNRYHATEEVQR